MKNLSITLVMVIALGFTCIVNAGGKIIVSIGDSLAIENQVVNENIVVEGGELIIKNSSINANVKVEDQGSLYISDETYIKGTLKGDGYSALTIDDSVIEGMMQLTNSGSNTALIQRSEFLNVVNIMASSIRSEDSTFHKAVHASGIKLYIAELLRNRLKGDLKVNNMHTAIVYSSLELHDITMNSNLDTFILKNNYIDGSVKVSSNRAVSFNENRLNGDLKVMDNISTRVQLNNITGTATIFPVDSGICSDIGNTFGRLKGGCD